MKKELGFGMAALGVLAAAGAVTAAVLKKRKDEEIYREAELKAMEELDGMLMEDEFDPDEKCEGCTCAEDCASCEAEEALCDCGGEDDAADEPAAEDAAEAGAEEPAAEDAGDAEDEKTPAE